MALQRRGLLDNAEERHGLMRSFSMRNMASLRRRTRHWKKLFRLKLGRRRVFWGLLVLAFMCMLAKLVMLNMLSDLNLNPVIRKNEVRDIPSSPKISPVRLTFLRSILYFLIMHA